MATYLELVTMLLEFTEKIPYAQTSAEQQALALRHINDAVRFVYNHGDLSFKTVILRGFVYTVQTVPASPSKGTPLPDDFMGFHKTGKVYIDDGQPRDPLIYLPYNDIIERTEGRLSNTVGIPTHYGLGGPSDGASALNQRELLLWPTPNTPTVTLKLIYQATAPEDVLDIASANVEVPRIPYTWHIPVVLSMGKVFIKNDKGADATAFSAALATAIKQMDIQEPHGREKPSRRRPHPAWRR